MSYSTNIQFVIAFAVVCLFSINVSAQEIAITEEGKEVYLKSDLEELSQEKRAAIKSQPEHFIVVNDKQELNSLDLIDEASKGSSKTHEVSVPADDELVQKVEELQGKVKRGEMSKEEAKAIYHKKYKQSLEGDSEKEDLSSDDLTRKEKKRIDREYDNGDDHPRDTNNQSDVKEKNPTWVKAQEMLDQGMTKEEIKKKLELKTFPE